MIQMHDSSQISTSSGFCSRAGVPISEQDTAHVSIVMATYNGERFIAAQLESLAAQTLVPYELIVSDDGSTDDTLSIVRNFSTSAPFPVQISQNNKRLGFGENFLSASRLATGKYIAFCDQDDVWHPEKLARCVNALRAEDALLCAHTAVLIDDASKPIGFFSNSIKTSGVWLPLTLPPWGVFAGFTQVIDRSILELIDVESRGLDHISKKGLLVHDRWAYFLASTFGKTVVLAEPFANYRQHDANLFGNKPAPLSKVLKGKLAVSHHDLLDHREIASHRAQILASAAEKYSESERELAYQAELASRRWTAIANIYNLRAALYEGEPFLSRLWIFVNLLKINAYAPFEQGGLCFKVLLKDFVMGVFRSQWINPKT
jgi:glycosyltransferase involved in cell wall biosynthesis